MAGQLAGVDVNSIEGKFKMLGTQSQVDDELAKMKGLITGSSSASQKTVGYLPPGQVDLELEALREEMNKQ